MSDLPPCRDVFPDIYIFYRGLTLNATDMITVARAGGRGSLTIPIAFKYPETFQKWENFQISNGKKTMMISV
jgi:hypothetical protein